MPIPAIGRPLHEKLEDEAVDSLVALINKSHAEQKKRRGKTCGRKIRATLI